MGDFEAGLEEIKRRLQGGISQGKPPLAGLHESVRLLPDQAHKALGEAGIDLVNPKKGDRAVIDDLRHFNKLPKFPWPEPPEVKPGPRGQQ